jgi:hypothetical protein
MEKVSDKKVKIEKTILQAQKRAGNSLKRKKEKLRAMITN